MFVNNKHYIIKLYFYYRFIYNLKVKGDKRGNYINGVLELKVDRISLGNLSGKKCKVRCKEGLINCI